MGWTEWIVSIGLIALVVRQVRGRRPARVSLLWPIALVAWAGSEYLSALPAYHSDWMFTACLAAVGLGLGVACGILISVFPDSEKVVARASAAAAVLWTIGMASRLAFGLVALHGGAELIGRLSIELNLHSQDTWATALIVMALGEVISRTVVLLVKYRSAVHALAGSSHPTATLTGDSPAPA